MRCERIDARAAYVPVLSPRMVGRGGEGGSAWNGVSSARDAFTVSASIAALAWIEQTEGTGAGGVTGARAVITARAE